MSDLELKGFLFRELLVGGKADSSLRLSATDRNDKIGGGG
jgi:hypothetical protein